MDNIIPSIIWSLNIKVQVLFLMTTKLKTAKKLCSNLKNAMKRASVLVLNFQNDVCERQRILLRILSKLTASTSSWGSNQKPTASKSTNSKLILAICSIWREIWPKLNRTTCLSSFSILTNKESAAPHMWTQLTKRACILLRRSFGINYISRRNCQNQVLIQKSSNLKISDTTGS